MSHTVQIQICLIKTTGTSDEASDDEGNDKEDNDHPVLRAGQCAILKVVPVRANYTS